MRILMVGRGGSGVSEWGGIQSVDEAMATGLIESGVDEVVRWSKSHAPGGKFDFVFYGKLRTYPEWLWSIAPTVSYYGDWRGDGNRQSLPLFKADHCFTNFDDDRGTYMPFPVMVKRFNPNRVRANEWLWTGSKSTFGSELEKEERDLDVEALPNETIKHGWTKNDKIFGTKFTDLVETHKFGLSVSQKNDIFKHSSSRLYYYMAGGITLAVRYFPGVEEIVCPGTFIYRERSELEEFIRSPQLQNPVDVWEYALNFCDSKVVMCDILKHIT
jgi:hypothetical protein